MIQARERADFDVERLRVAHPEQHGTSGGGEPFGWGTTQVAASFKGAKSGQVEPVLESLAALGLIVGYETDAGKWWRAARPSVLPPE